jgi:TPR repeat protein
MWTDNRCPTALNTSAILLESLPNQLLTVFRYWRLAALQGHPYAMHYLGTCYDQGGHHTPTGQRDEDACRYWMTLSVQKGSTLSHEWLTRHQG